MSADGRLQSSCDFLRLLRGRAIAGEFGRIRVSQTSVASRDNAGVRGLLDETDKVPVAWRLVVYPGRTAKPMQNGAADGIRFLEAVLARVESGEYADVAITESGSLFDVRGTREEKAGEVDRFAKACRRGLVEYTENMPRWWKIVAVRRKSP